MKILWLCAILHTAFAQSGFGKSYLKNSRLCHQWSCINEKLGLIDSLPPREQYANVLKNLLPAGPWQDVVTPVLDACYGDRPRIYTNTCPGQALMHCTIEHLIQNCPEESLRKKDACAPLSSLAGFKYMFSQSQYLNFEKNLPTEQRPTWFLRNYFNTKCCNIPALFNSTVMSECGFNSIVYYHVHEPRNHIVAFNPLKTPSTTTPANQVKDVDISVNTIETANPDESALKVKIVYLPTVEDAKNDTVDPLDCCDTSQFIPTSWRSECDFHLSWTGQGRLSIDKPTRISTTPAPTTTTAKPAMHDVKIVPLTCQQETCVFKKLNVVSEVGAVDMNAFSKLLDNFTNSHPAWTKAKARVVTKCLSKPIREYVDDCEINKVLACTFDVLTESCPLSTINDPCKHSNALRKGTTCQINSSKYRPKNRRQFCVLPNLLDNTRILYECGITSLSRVEYVPDPIVLNKHRKYSWSNRYMCKELSPSTKCILNKMDVLNKYGFMDYFKMKDRIRRFTDDHAWSSLSDVYLGAFTGMPMYKEHCSSPKKLLNIVDAMLMTCPVSKRKLTSQCDKLLNDIANTVPVSSQLQINQNLDQVWRHFRHVFVPREPMTFLPSRVTQKKVKYHKNPEFDFGILNSKDAPKVTTIDLTPKNKAFKKNTRLTPLLRMTGIGKGSISIRPLYHDGVFRSDPFALHNKIAAAHTTTEPNFS